VTRRLRIRPAVRRDLARLATFFADAPPDIAEEMTRRIEQRIARLTRFPFIGRPYASGALRETIVAYGKSRYVVRYRVTDDAVIITRIWHGKENRPR
jgi:toxin ParE1/3/4